MSRIYRSAAYTGKGSFEGSAMSDEVEKKIENPPTARSLEEIVRASQFTDTSKQNSWSEATADYRTTQKDSATMEALSDQKIAEIKANGGFQKFELFDSKAEAALEALQKPATEQALIASNIAPNIPNFEQKQQYQDIQSDLTAPIPDSIVAKSLREHALGTDIVRMTTGPDIEHKIWPYRGQEKYRLAECTASDPKAWEHAYEAFPKLSAHLSAAQATKVMKALVWNELNCYSFEDAGQDAEAKRGTMEPTSKETVGYAQISPRAIKEFETGKTANGATLREPYPQLAEYFQSKGYNKEGYQSQVLEDPTCIPMIVAAKLESLCDYYDSHRDKVTGGKIEINSQSLVYGFNADVFYNPHNKANPGFHSNPLPVVAQQMETRLGNEKAFPTSDPNVLSASRHLQNVSKVGQLLEAH
jgi:hypothetical protein